MATKTVDLGNGIEKSSTTKTVFRVSNGRVESRAFRDFPDSRFEAGDKIDMYRVNKAQKIEVFPGDILIRATGTHEIG